MFSRRFKTGYLALEGLNSFATVYYFYYFYFFMQKEYGFGNQANLSLAALNGATYAVFAWAGGKFAQRFGYFLALKVGFIVMMCALGCGWYLRSAPGQILVMASTVVGMSFIWPTLEALVSEGEPREGLQHMVGIYNVVWAATAAAANFTGGAMLEKLGLQSLFYVPMAIVLSQLGLTLWLEWKAKQAQLKPSGEQSGRLPSERAAELVVARSSELAVAHSSVAAVARPGPVAAAAAYRAHPPFNAQKFLRMAWLANPFAYVAINTLIAAMPGVAARLGLSTMLAGFCGSVWCFARLGAFAWLWYWPGWHYRLRWLLLSYLALIGAFATILLAPNLTLLVSAQIMFGGAVGLIYSSSLFYSMDCSETKGEHGGIHEAAIGLGNLAGPATGAAALYLLPRYSNSGALAVSLLLLGGLAGLAVIWHRRTEASQRGS